MAQTSFSRNFHDFYTIDENEVLGHGSYKCVVTCKSKADVKEFALKRITESLHKPCMAIVHEISILKECSNQENIIQLIDLFLVNNTFHFVFEIMPGGNLMDRLNSKVVFDNMDTVVIVKCVVRALKFLHSKQYVHRNVKLNTIYCSGKEYYRRVKLTGMGLCAVGEAFNEPVGSIEYMAPEMVRVKLNPDDHTNTYGKGVDMWSLGVVMFRLLAGKMPFELPFCDTCKKIINLCPECKVKALKKILKGKYHMSQISVTKFPEETGLVKGMLNFDSASRWTADKVSQLEWIPELSVYVDVVDAAKNRWQNYFGNSTDNDE